VSQTGRNADRKGADGLSACERLEIQRSDRDIRAHSRC
jgi:hypothetical protein